MNRSRHVFTCGHTSEYVEDDRIVKIKSIDRNGRHCIESMMICQNCAVWYRKNNLIIDHEVQAERWLAGNGNIINIG